MKTRKKYIDSNMNGSFMSGQTVMYKDDPYGYFKIIRVREDSNLIKIRRFDYNIPFDVEAHELITVNEYDHMIDQVIIDSTMIDDFPIEFLFD